MIMQPLSTAQFAIGPVKPANTIFLAPMSGVSDLPFRQLAHRFGAGLVISEMVASADLVRNRPDVRRRAENIGIPTFVVQLAGHEARWMAEGARVAAALGADMIDINMGCPAREVTGKQAGSALMRAPDHAVRLIEAVVNAVDVPVSLKMRLGWDADNINAAALASRAEAAGVRMITVHGRTRCQFFKGKADWAAVAAVKSAVDVPVIVNGDIATAAQLETALGQSGADGAMIGRAAYGAPWLPGRLAQAFATGREPAPPPLRERLAIAVEHVELMLSHYGTALGLRNARKHIAWYLAGILSNEAELKRWRRTLCTQDTPAPVFEGLRRAFETAHEAAA
jgi:tRNA-dihydrouridine synthase B